jgi:hypothetical protein
MSEIKVPFREVRARMGGFRDTYFGRYDPAILAFGAKGVGIVNQYHNGIFEYVPKKEVRRLFREMKGGAVNGEMELAPFDVIEGGSVPHYPLNVVKEGNSYRVGCLRLTQSEVSRIKRWAQGPKGGESEKGKG